MLVAVPKNAAIVAGFASETASCPDGFGGLSGAGAESLDLGAKFFRRVLTAKFLAAIISLFG